MGAGVAVWLPLPADALPVVRAAWARGLDTWIIARALTVLFGEPISEAAVANSLPLVLGKGPQATRSAIDLT